MKLFICVLFMQIVFSVSSLGQFDDGRIISQRIVKSPWNVDKLSPDDIRCYCNLAVCITSSYMCRTARSSDLGGCFSEIHDQNENPETARHGCVELLPDDNQKVKCDNSPRKHNNKINSNSNKIDNLNKIETLMLCCQEDMCNHVDNHKKLRMNFTTDNSDETLFKSGGQSNPNFGYHQQPTDSEKPVQLSPSGDYNPNTINNDQNNNEFWFKVATILVPVLGAIIVVILLIFAIRMLKNDSNFDSNSKLGNPCMGSRKIPIDLESSYNHSPLLKQQSGAPLPSTNSQIGYHPHSLNSSNSNSDKKNEHQAKINQLLHLEYSLLPQSCNDPNIKLTNTDIGSINSMYRNVNLSLSQNRNRDTSDKIYEKEVLNPVTVNWAGSAGIQSSNSYGM